MNQGCLNQWQCGLKMILILLLLWETSADYRVLLRKAYRLGYYFINCFSDVSHLMKRCLEFKYDVDPVAAACKVVRDMEKKAVSSVSPSVIHSPQLHHPDDVQAGMLVSSQQTLIFACLSFVKYTY